MNARLHMDADGLMHTLADEIVAWVNETRAILTTIKRIVEYFGNDAEYEWLSAALCEREAYLEGVLPAFRDPGWRADIPYISIPRFTFERSTAEKITPLLQLIVEPVPDFIPWARGELEPSHYKAVMRHAGVFLGDMAVDICDPIWASFPDLTPEGYELGTRRMPTAQS
jgi:hypothetical protein